MASKKRFHHTQSKAGMYEGHNERRKQEMQDGGMIVEDHKAIANMPQEVRYHDWPGKYQGLDGDLNDTISGINQQLDKDESGMKKNNVPKKW